VHDDAGQSTERRVLTVLRTADTASSPLGSESGFTLVEVLVATVLGLLVVGVGATMFTAAIQSQPKQSARGAKVQQARTTMERLVRELRQGGDVYTATSSQLAFLTYVHSAACGGAPSSSSIQCRVTYSCSAGACTRVEATPTGANPGPAETVASGLSNAAVFTYSPSTTAPAYVGATLSYPAAGGDDAITLQDGATLRNPS
jgi:Tfp pilus assembly protein PilW